jgi:hypothetical protein
MVVIDFRWNFSRHYHHSSLDPRSFLLTLFPKRLLIICIHGPVELPYNFSIHITNLTYGSVKESIAVVHGLNSKRQRLRGHWLYIQLIQPFKERSGRYVRLQDCSDCRNESEVLGRCRPGRLGDDREIPGRSEGCGGRKAGCRRREGEDYRLQSVVKLSLKYDKDKSSLKNARNRQKRAAKYPSSAFFFTQFQNPPLSSR